MFKLGELNKIEYKAGVIYLITNKFNSKRFIGVSEHDIEKDIEEVLLSEEGKHLKQAIKKYGKNNFTIEILEDNQPSYKLKGLKNYYIINYNSFFIYGEGYNVLVKEDKNKEDKPVKYRYYTIKDNSTKFYRNYNEVSKDLGLAEETIKKIFNGYYKNTICEELGKVINGELVKVEYIKGKFKRNLESEKKSIDKHNRIKKEYIEKYNLEEVINADLSKWINRELIKEDKDLLCKELNLKNTSVNTGGWNTVKKYLKLSGLYDIVDKRIMIY